MSEEQSPSLYKLLLLSSSDDFALLRREHCEDCYAHNAHAQVLRTFPLGVAAMQEWAGLVRLVNSVRCRRDCPNYKEQAHSQQQQSMTSEARRLAIQNQRLAAAAAARKAVVTVKYKGLDF